VSELLVVSAVSVVFLLGGVVSVGACSDSGREQTPRFLILGGEALRLWWLSRGRAASCLGMQLGEGVIARLQHPGRNQRSHPRNRGRLMFFGVRWGARPVARPAPATECSLLAAQPRHVVPGTGTGPNAADQ